MSELSPETAALLAEARRSRFPDEATLSEIERALQKKLDRLDARPAPLLSQRALALAIVAIVLAVASSVAAYGVVRALASRPERPSATDEGSRRAARSAARSGHHGWPRLLAEDAPTPPPSDGTPRITRHTAGERREPQPCPRPRHAEGQGVAASQVVDAAVPVEAAPPADVALIEETRLLQVAQGALRDHQPVRALEVLEEHERRFPAGTLSLEREAARLVAQCQLGSSDETRARAERFVASHPGSIHTARVTAACLE
jgi:hypothetical protein